MAAQLLPHFTPSGQITPSLLHSFTLLGSPILTSFYVDRKQRKRGGLGRQLTWGDLGAGKTPKPKAKKARGVGKATNLGDLGRVEPQELKAKKARGVWEANQPGGIWGG